MTNTEINIAIAEACGVCMHPDGLKRWYETPHVAYHEGRRCRVCFTDASVPSYTTDLNLMHKAEKQIIYAETANASMVTMFELWITENVEYPTHATAAQRAEAFLKAIGGWKE